MCFLLLYTQIIFCFCRIYLRVGFSRLTFSSIWYLLSNKVSNLLFPASCLKLVFTICSLSLLWFPSSGTPNYHTFTFLCLQYQSLFLKSFLSLVHFFLMFEIFLFLPSLLIASLVLLLVCLQFWNDFFFYFSFFSEFCRLISEALKFWLCWSFTTCVIFLVFFSLFWNCRFLGCPPCPQSCHSALYSPFPNNNFVWDLTLPDTACGSFLCEPCFLGFPASVLHLHVGLDLLLLSCLCCRPAQFGFDSQSFLLRVGTCPMRKPCSASF